MFALALPGDVCVLFDLGPTEQLEGERDSSDLFELGSRFVGHLGGYIANNMSIPMPSLTDADAGGIWVFACHADSSPSTDWSKLHVYISERSFYFFLWVFICILRGQQFTQFNKNEESTMMPPQQREVKIVKMQEYLGNAIAIPYFPLVFNSMLPGYSTVRTRVGEKKTKKKKKN